MKISTKGRYAIRMMLDLAKNQGKGFVSLKDVAKRQEISKKYLEQIIPILNRSDILSANRGFQGGYRLARAPKDYTIREILELTEGSLAPVACLEGSSKDCPRKESCITLKMWTDLHRLISDYFEGITLQDLLDGQEEMIQDNYVI